MALNIVCVDVNSTVRCVVEGELDLASQSAALEELIPAIERARGAVVLDLSGVEFIDSTGLRVLLACKNRAEESSTQLLLASVSRAVRQLFDVTKMGDRFDYAEGG